MHEEIAKNKLASIRQLEEGLERNCADDIAEVLINLADGTCGYLDLIPVLERVADRDSFYYFDDNGAGGFPHADRNRETSFRAWARQAIENIKENARFAAQGDFADLLKSNDTRLIKNALLALTSEGVCADQNLIPILEKIVRKNEYKSYSYYSGYKTDCYLGELAREALEIIRRNAVSPAQDGGGPLQNNEKHNRCSLCQALPDDSTANTGRDDYLPAEFRDLVSVDREYDGEFRRCQGCGTYFNWINMPQMYGSGNSDEERLVRLSREASDLLDKIFSADESAWPKPDEVEDYLKFISLELLVSALGARVYRRPQIVAPFVPELLRVLIKKDDTAMWELFRSYISDRPERAEDVLNAFRNSDDWGSTRLSQILHQALRVTAKKNTPEN